MIDRDHVFNITCTSKIDNDSTDSIACNCLSQTLSLMCTTIDHQPIILIIMIVEFEHKNASWRLLYKLSS